MRRFQFHRFAVQSAMACALTVALGCSGAINPFNDDSTPATEISTPSARELRAAQAPSALRDRDWPVTELAAGSGDVLHYPLWFEDPFVDKGSQDDRFAWTLEDYFAMPYSPTRWFVNGAALPVSMIVTPPFTPMVSDGHLSRQALGHDHDAARIRDVGMRADRQGAVSSP